MQTYGWIRPWFVFEFGLLISSAMFLWEAFDFWPWGLKKFISFVILSRVKREVIFWVPGGREVSFHWTKSNLSSAVFLQFSVPFALFNQVFRMSLPFWFWPPNQALPPLAPSNVRSASIIIKKLTFAVCPMSYINLWRVAFADKKICWSQIRGKCGGKKSVWNRAYEKGKVLQVFTLLSEKLADHWPSCALRFSQAGISAKPCKWKMEMKKRNGKINRTRNKGGGGAREKGKKEGGNFFFFQRYKKIFQGLMCIIYNF